MTIFIAGDFCPKERIAKLIEEKNYSFFDKIASIIKQADYSIVNFECPVAEEGAKPICKAGPALHTSRNAVDAIKYAGFDCATLANNHFRDYGDVGCMATIDELKRQNIDYVGGGMNITEAQKVLFKTIGNKKIAIVNICENEFSIAATDHAGSAPLDTVDNYHQICSARKNADYVLVITHGGHEMYQLPSPRMRKLYRYFIDLGADAVVNHHQHCFSGYEYHHDKPIIYGLGNFCFDWAGKRDSIWNEGYGITLSFEDRSIKLQLHPYTQCNDIPDVSPLDSYALIKFNKRILELNDIIVSDTKLQTNFINWITKVERSKQSLLSSWHNKYLDIAARKKIIPIPLSRNRAKSLLNHISCEAHRDISIEVLRRKINQ